MLLVIHVIMVVALLLLGIMFACGKGTDLIAGYNTLPAEEKAKYDKNKLCRAMSRLMFALSACWLVIALSEIFKTLTLLYIGLSLFCIVAVAGAFIVNKGCRKQ